MMFRQLRGLNAALRTNGVQRSCSDRLILITAAQLRSYSVTNKIKDFNKSLNKIGDESTKESVKTLKYLRMAGGWSIVLVICSIMWASTLTEPIEEEVVISDLGKDVRHS